MNGVLRLCPAAGQPARLTIRIKCKTFFLFALQWSLGDSDTKDIRASDETADTQNIGFDFKHVHLIDCDDGVHQSWVEPDKNLLCTESGQIDRED